MENIFPVHKCGDIPLPEGYIRKTYDSVSFPFYLRNLHVKQENNLVYLYDGRLKQNQNAQYCVIKMDIGKEDLQQCADAVIRLRAEYLFSQQRFNEIHFNFTSGHIANYLDYASGQRPAVKGNQVNWIKTARPDYSYTNFRKYLDVVFTYAGSYSLSQELKTINRIEDIEAGDVFIQGGFPGHAVIVIDLAIHKNTGKKIFMLAQSYMPAQEIHVLVNPDNKDLSPWYNLPYSNELYTPQWTFSEKDLKRF